MSNQAQKEVQLSPLTAAAEACRAIMETYTPEELPPAGRWHYHQGVFLVGMFQLWKVAGDNQYLDYIKGYVNHLVDEHGNLLLDRGELDSVQAGLLLLELDEALGDSRYRKAADKLLHLLSTMNRTTEGGYWHKDKYPYQMWLDGLYMGGVYTMQYGLRYDRPELFEQVLYQEKLMRTHTRDEKTGLYHHAWDESKKMPWADPDTGRSPEFWGRALGWYALSLVEFLDMLPAGHEGRGVLEEALRDLAGSLVRYQDPESGLWYQVLDKGDRPDNWLETSCTSLFVYALAKGARLSCLDASFKEAANRGFEGLLRTVYNNDKGLLVLPEICIGTGVGDYKHYVERPRSENDLHGVGAFVMACVEIGRSES
ncbi:glycoside hydrolase family 88/105 protein [Paenibacillus campinasensis]|uniref:Glycoside hydrolase 105 family protein n=1 Tax=Paenibacillus campinasensis TaxID=66347 RepID=A0A268ES13_9BACL|nr:glycoside hydrolase family 88 protein [Paenibacillus campinasensis]PAD75917.1 glycoside hydrolase 105 family protein [Paenibacillus campinasensis]